MSMDFQGETQTPSKRPVLILVVGVIFIALGLLDTWRGARPLMSQPAHLAGDDLEVLGIGIAALLGGICVLQGRDWARWLLAAWMALHVALSMRQPYALLAHLVIFGLILTALFHPKSSTYFRRPKR